MEKIKIYHKVNHQSHYFKLCALCLKNTITHSSYFNNFNYTDSSFGSIYLIGGEYRKLTGIENKGIKTFNKLKREEFVEVESKELFVDLVETMLQPNQFIYVKKVNSDNKTFVMKLDLTEFKRPTEESSWKVIESPTEVIEHFNNKEYEISRLRFEE